MKMFDQFYDAPYRYILTFCKFFHSTFGKPDSVLDREQISDRFILHTEKSRIFLYYDFLAIIKQLLESRERFAWAVFSDAGIGEAEDEILGCLDVQLSQQLQDAVLEIDSHAGVVWLKKDVDTVRSTILPM